MICPFMAGNVILRLFIYSYSIIEIVFLYFQVLVFLWAYISDEMSGSFPRTGSFGQYVSMNRLKKVSLVLLRPKVMTSFTMT